MFAWEGERGGYYMAAEHVIEVTNNADLKNEMNASFYLSGSSRNLEMTNK
jgi:hypothetical protein